MIPGQADSDFFSDWDKQDTGNGVTDERGDNLEITGENDDVSVSVQKRVQTKTIGDRMNTTVSNEKPDTRSRIPSPMMSSRPLLVTPLPNAMPPIARKTIVHANCSKSSWTLLSHRKYRRADLSPSSVRRSRRMQR